MKNPFHFFAELNRRKIAIVLWVYYLVVINLSSAFFWQEPLAQTIFFTFLLSASSILGLYAHFGFTKIMGLGHIFWFPLLILLLPQVAESTDGYRIYLAILSFSIIISLAFDTVDVWKYISRHERLEYTSRSNHESGE